MHEPTGSPDRHGTAVGIECSLPISRFALAQLLDGLILRIIASSLALFRTTLYLLQTLPQGPVD
jgi:hypothetical protein